MKKLLVAVMALFILASCSSDDDSTPSPYGNPDPNTVLVKKIIKTYPTGYELTSTYVYDGTKVVSVINSDGTHEEYEYDDNDLPISLNFYQGDHLSQAKHFHYYEDGRLKTYTTSFTDGMYTNRYEYSYADNGSVTAETFTGYLMADDYWSDVTFTFENDNITNVHESTYFSDNYNYTYTYDGKNAYDKNVSGKTALDLARWKGGNANPVQSVGTHWFEGQEPSDYGSWTIAYTYNSENYPITATETLPDGTIQIQYFYE